MNLKEIQNFERVRNFFTNYGKSNQSISNSQLLDSSLSQLLIALPNFRRKFTIIIALVAPTSCSHFVNNLVVIFKMTWLTQCRYFKVLLETQQHCDLKNINIIIDTQRCSVEKLFRRFFQDLPESTKMEPFMVSCLGRRLPLYY